MTSYVFWIMIIVVGLVSGLRIKNRKCHGPDCGACHIEIIDPSPYCSNHGKSTRIMYWHDTSGGCGQNNGPYQCTCYEGYEPASQDAGSTPGCSRCSANYDNNGTASNLVCVKACAMQPMLDRSSKFQLTEFESLNKTIEDQKVLVGDIKQTKTIEYENVVSYEVNLPDEIPVLPTFEDGKDWTTKNSLPIPPFTPNNTLRWN